MDIEEVLSFIKEQLIKKNEQSLTRAQAELIKYFYCWPDKTYYDLEAPFYGYTVGFVRTALAPKLWRTLSEVIGERVKKTNLKSVLEETLRNSKVGQVIRERYKITELINKGEFGNICLAEDLEQEKQRCVIKQFNRKQNDETTSRRFHTEVGCLYQLNWHRQIASYIDHFEDEENFYIVYKYQEGEALSQKLPEEESGKPWTEDAVIHLLLSILNVLEFVHKKAMIHRDIRPSNLIQSPGGEICLINFGSIKDLSLSQTTNLIISFTGTIGYSAPELLAGNPKLGSDIYSVGMLGIQALTGVPPIKFNIDFKIDKIIWKQPTNLNQKLAKILDKMAHRDWKERYRSATEALKEAEELL